MNFCRDFLHPEALRGWLASQISCVLWQAACSRLCPNFVWVELICIVIMSLSCTSCILPLVGRVILRKCLSECLPYGKSTPLPMPAWNPNSLSCLQAQGAPFSTCIGTPMSLLRVLCPAPQLRHLLVIIYQMTSCSLVYSTDWCLPYPRYFLY